MTESDTLTFQCSVEGYSMNDDSLPRMTDFKAHYKHKIIQTNTVTTIEKIKPQKQNKWHISPQIGIGYGLTNKKADIFIGIGINYNI